MTPWGLSLLLPCQARDSADERTLIRAAGLGVGSMDEHLHIPRTYVSKSFSQALNKELCVFSDAFILATAAEAHLRVKNTKGQRHVEFVMSKSKLAPFFCPMLGAVCLSSCRWAWYLAASITQQGGFTCIWPTGSHAYRNQPQLPCESCQNTHSCSKEILSIHMQRYLQ